MMDGGNEVRISKLEERMMDLRIVLTALEWQLKDLLLWKSHAEMQLAELVKAEEIADAVSKRIHKTNTLRLTKVQQLLGGMVGLTAMADFILRLTGKG